MRFVIATVALLLGGVAEAKQLGLYNYGTGSNPESHYTNGYTRNDGTYVNGYHATNPNTYQGDNYGARGNVNPYNGQIGNGDD